MKMQTFVILYAAQTDTENVRRLNFVAVEHTTFQSTRLPLYPELLWIPHDFLYSAWTDSEPFKYFVHACALLYNAIICKL
jgi:hypothetical protein